MGILTARIGSILILLIISLFAVAAQSQKMKYYQISGSFDDKTFYCDISLECKAEREADRPSIARGALLLTPDTANLNPEFSLFNKVGRVLLRQPFKLWDNNTRDRVASFNTSFLVNISPVLDHQNVVVGEGLTFLIAPNLDLPPDSHGEFLGLTNAFNDGNNSNRIIAVELDTNKQDFDPDGDHVGLNINSVRSVNWTELLPKGSRWIDDNAFHNVWVNYDGIKMVIQVYMAVQNRSDDPTPPLPLTPMIEVSLDLRKYLAQQSYFGFSASTGSDTNQTNCVRRWNLTVEYFPDQKKDPLIRILLGVGILVVMMAVILVAGLGYYIHKMRKVVQSQSTILSQLKALPGMPKEYKYKELKKATNNFNEKRKLGQGGYGVVYKGVLPEEGLEIAVKRFLSESIKGEIDFLAELTIINRLRHKHLVRLLGWCHKNGKLLLVYEYMPKGSLDMNLFGTKDTVPLSWSLRYKIVSGLASALNYLHYEYDQKVVHRDIKPSNIMLDSDYNARLGDFGLARALDNEKTSYAGAEGGLQGTLGYIAPECFLTGKATQHSDVYAFGAVLMEVVCGQKLITKIGGFQSLVDWVWCLYREGRILDAVDEKIVGDDDLEWEEAKRLLLLGLACSHPIASERPVTQVIVQIIAGAVPVPSVPPFKPAFIWPAFMPIGDLTDTTSIDIDGDVAPDEATFCATFQ